MPLRVIRDLLEREDAEPERLRAMIELEDRILERALAGERERIPAEEVAKPLRGPRGGPRSSRRAGGAGPDRRGYSPSDVRIVEAISRFRAGGYDERIGFTVYDTLRYKRALEPLVAEEVEVLTQRLAGDVDPDRARGADRGRLGPAQRPDRRAAHEAAGRRARAPRGGPLRGTPAAPGAGPSPDAPWRISRCRSRSPVFAARPPGSGPGAARRWRTCGDHLGRALASSCAAPRPARSAPSRRIYTPWIDWSVSPVPPDARRCHTAQLDGRQGPQRRDRRASRARRCRRGRGARGPAREVEPAGRLRRAARGSRAARRPDDLGGALLGPRAGHPPGGRQHRRAQRRAREVVQHLDPDRARRRARGPLPQDPHVRRRRRRGRLPRVRARGARRGDRHRRARRRARGGDPRDERLLRPALPGALPDPRRARGDGDHRPLRLHARDRQGPLGRPAARPGDREPGLRGRAQPDRRGAASLPLLRSLRDPRSLGRGPGAGAGRASASSPPTSTSSCRSGSARTLPSLANRRPASYRWPEEVARGAEPA